MAKRRTKGRDDDATEAPKGAVTGTGVEEERDMASEKGAGDAVAAAEDDVVIRASVHCDGCARKLRRSLQRFDGVGEVSVDSRTNKVIMRGPRAVESAREALEIVERKTGKKATLLSPPLDKLPLPAVKGAQAKKDDADGDLANEIADVDTEMVVVLRMNMHCDACSEEIKRRILKIEGVKEAVPLLKSSQMIVKGMVEPATLVGFIRNSTGRKAAIIRAEPLDLLPTTKSPPMDAPVMEAETKHQDPTDNLGEKKDGHDKEAPPQEEDHAGGEKLGTEKPSHDHGAEGHVDTHDGGAPNNGGGDGVVLENNKKDDRLFTVPLPPGVVTVAPEMALTKINPYYSYPAVYPYAHLHHYYQCPPQYYPYAYNPPAMYGYPHYPAEAFSEENPNACTIA
ncbi:hypothetical protein EJB05_57120, partial [Eragrostis curvula]